MWFPKPKTSAELEILGPGAGFSPQTLFDSLHAPDAVEWKEKVGVMTPADGSAKPTARLLRSGKWVFKTDIGQQTGDKTALRSQLQRLAALSLQVDLWHPEKLWFLMQTEQQLWMPVSVCPRLTTIRQIDGWDGQIRWWSRMIIMGLEMSLKHGIGLDLNPSNFAFSDPLSDQLYYLDDEFYAQHNFFDIAEAVVARIPEDPTVPAERWRQWGAQLKGALQPFCREQEDWRHFLDGIHHYPLTTAMEAQRSALVDGLSQSAPRPTTSVRTQRHDAKLTCVFADVHGNLPAFDRILKEAKSLNADSYFFLGDIVSYGPFPRQCIERLAELRNCICIRGNHDNTSGSGMPENGSNRIAREVDMWTHSQLTQDEREWLLNLPIEHSAAPWLLVHGAPQDPRRFYAYVYELTYGDNLSYLEQHDFSACFYGHTHVQFVHRRLADGTDEKLTPDSVELFKTQEYLLLNPGSVGQPRDGDPRAAFALWNRETNVVTFHRVSYPVETTVQAIKKEGLPEDLIYRLEVGR